MHDLMVTDSQSSKNLCSQKSVLKGNARFIFLRDPQKSLANACVMKVLKIAVTKRVIVCFYNFGEETFKK